MVALIVTGILCILAGVGVGYWIAYVLYTPEKQMMAKVHRDMKHRLDKDGLPLNPLNDYERHLCALNLKFKGETREYIANVIEILAKDVPEKKRHQYAKDVLKSTIVNFPMEVESAN